MKKVMIALSCVVVFSCASNKTVLEEVRQPAQVANFGTFLFSNSTQLSDAIKLNCSVVIYKVNSSNGSASNEQRFFKLKDTQAVGFSAVGDVIIDGDVKLEVYAKLAPSAKLSLSIAKKNNSSVTPWLSIGSASSNMLVSGQTVTLNSRVNDLNYEIACFDKQ